jgi:hypothetical protein
LNTTEPELTHEERLKAVAYQFIALYERWSEDRQVAQKQGADTAELVKLFTAEVKAFKEVEPAVRQAIASSIQVAANSAAKLINEKIELAALQAVEKTTQRLSYSVERAERELTRYQQELTFNHWVAIAVSFFATMFTSLLIVWLLMPNPTLPLTPKQITYLNSGKAIELVWPKLSKTERQHLLNAFHQVDKELLY